MTQAFVPLRAPSSTGVDPDAAGKPLAAVAPMSMALRRVDTVLDQLVVAESAVADLVRSLQPVLPQDFPDRPVVHLEQEEARSPLAAGLADLTARGGALVVQLRALCDAVDL